MVRIAISVEDLNEDDEMTDDTPSEFYFEKLMRSRVAFLAWR